MRDDCPVHKQTLPCRAFADKMTLKAAIEMLRQEVELLRRSNGDALVRSAICDDSLERVLCFLEMSSIGDTRISVSQ